MREDMGKIAVDSYRFKGYGADKIRSKLRHPKFRDRLAEMPSKVSMSRSLNGGSHPGEYLSPLYRWVAKQVGRRWDDIYSEINQTLRGGYTNLEHIKSHVFDRVKTGQIKLIDRWPHYMSDYGWGRDDPWLPLREEQMYVDERGVLRNPPDRKWHPSNRREKRQPVIIMLDGMTAAAKINGVWFASDLSVIPEHEAKVIDYMRCSPYRDPERIVYKTIKVKDRVSDALIELLHRKRLNGRWVYEQPELDFRAPYDTRNIYAPSIRTMSKKEIKQRIPADKR